MLKRKSKKETEGGSFHICMIFTFHGREYRKNAVVLINYMYHENAYFFFFMKWMYKAWQQYSTMYFPFLFFLLLLLPSLSLSSNCIVPASRNTWMTRLQGGLSPSVLVSLALPISIANLLSTPSILSKSLPSTRYQINLRSLLPRLPQKAKSTTNYNTGMVYAEACWK